MIEVRTVGGRNKGVHPRLIAWEEEEEVERERLKIIEKTLTKLSGVQPTVFLTQGMDLCNLFMDIEDYECSRSCPKFHECGCEEDF